MIALREDIRRDIYEHDNIFIDREEKKKQFAGHRWRKFYTFDQIDIYL